MSSTALRRNELGFAEVLFQALASAAPGLSVTLAVVVGANFAGGSLSLALVFALVGILLVATCIGQMAQRFPSAAGFYTYVSRGLHASMGLVGDARLDRLRGAVHGARVQLRLHGRALLDQRRDRARHDRVPDPRHPRADADRQGRLEQHAVGVRHRPRRRRGLRRHVRHLRRHGLRDLRLRRLRERRAARRGGEEPAPGGDEGRRALAADPRHLHHLLHVRGDRLLRPGALRRVHVLQWRRRVDRRDQGRLARRLVHPLVRAAEFVHRERQRRHQRGYAAHVLDGRINLLPRSFARTSERTGVPVVALAFIAAIALLATYITGNVLDGGPLEAFAFLGTIETITAILLYMLVSLAALVYFLRVRESGYNPLLHTVVPILAIVVMIPALMAAWITVGWLVLGVIYAVWVWTAHPDRARATEHIFLDDPQPEAVPAPAVAATV